MKRTFIILFFSIALGKLFSQGKEFNNWHFGDNCGITFNTNPPTVLNNSRISTFEGSSSISDSLGNILFYTDGRFVYDKTNNQMSNGIGLYGHISTTQSALIVPNPKKKNLYYIFTADAQAGMSGSASCGGCFAYSIVDLNLNGGLGDVIVKNNVLFSTVTEKIAAYKNPSDSTFWVITHEYNTNNFYVYKVDSNGVNSAPMITTIGIGHSLSSWSTSTHGQMKISPDGTKLAYVILSNGYLELFDFNASTGQISNTVSMKTDFREIYGLEFSPNSKLLYLTDNHDDTKIKQYSLLNWTSSAILNSAITLDSTYTTLFWYSQLQLAPDGKIYVSRANLGLWAIHNPDIKGTGCNFSHSGISFPPTGVYGPPVPKLGLPNSISGFYKTDYIPEIVNTVDEGLCSDPIIPNILTPNGDGINDKFTINCNSEISEPTDLIIYNRWGEEVYNASKKSTHLNDINDGIYFYAFTINDKAYKGHITLLHNRM